MQNMRISQNFIAIRQNVCYTSVMNKQRYSQITVISALILALCLCTLSFVACDKRETPCVDYTLDNDFYVEFSNTQDYRIFCPKIDKSQPITAKYGLIFYVGTGIDASYYDYLGTALAKQGYLTLISKNTFAYAQYQTTESAFSMYPDVKFFVGGHSQGGGCAIRRAKENSSSLLGALLFAPIAYRHKLLDKDNNPVLDDNGIEIYVKDSLVDAALPVLLLQASADRVLSDDIKADALSRLNKDRTQQHTLSPASHMSFSTFDDDAVLALFNGDGDGITQQEKDAQRIDTVQLSLAYMRAVVLK